MKYWILFIGVFIFGCRSQSVTNVARCDIRQGDRFFSINIDKEGNSYVVRGVGSNHLDSLEIVSSDTSQLKKLDSAVVFFKKLDEVKKHPVIGTERLGAPRIEIYYYGEKIYDAYNWNHQFWQLVQPIIPELPKGYNPFIANDFNFSSQTLRKS